MKTLKLGTKMITIPLEEKFHVSIVAVADDGREYVAAKSNTIYSGNFEAAKASFLKTLDWDFSKRCYLVKKSPLTSTTAR
jgi:hypothetical protein